MAKEGLRRRCSGIDVHKNSVSVCVLPAEGQKDESVKRRNFPTFTRDLKQLRNWLKNCAVTEIAMESTSRPVSIGARCGTCWKASLRSCCW